MAPCAVEWYWHHLHIYLHETGSDTVSIIQVTVAVVITVRIIAEESKSGSSGDVDDSDKGGMLPSQKKKRRKGFGSVSPLNQHSNVFNHKPKCLLHVT